MRWFGIVGLFWWLLCACGSSSGEPLKADGQAVSGCNDFVDSWCTVTTDCAVAAQVISEVDHADEIAACRAEAKADVACANALALGSTYDVCMADVEQLPCDGVVEKLNLGQAPELPSSCRGIVVASP